MPLHSTAYPHGFLLNRRSYEGRLRPIGLSKAASDMNHRSIHSDPGVCFQLNQQNSDNFLISDRIMRRLEVTKNEIQRVVMRRRNTGPGSLLSSDAGFCDSYSDRFGFISPGFGYYPTKQYVYEQDSLDCKTFATSRRNKVNRKAYVLDSSFSNTERVKSTSLSSSAASLYSEDDIMGSSSNTSPSSFFTYECPSITTGSCMSLYNAANQDENETNELAGEYAICSFDDDKKSLDHNNFAVNINNKHKEQDSQNEFSFSESLLVGLSLCELPGFKDECQNEEYLCEHQLKRSSNTDDDVDDDELEQCAISEFWRFEEDVLRWSRLDSKSPFPESPSAKLPLNSNVNPTHCSDEENNDDPSIMLQSYDDKIAQNVPEKEFENSESDTSDKAVASKPFRPKANSFLKRFGGDLKRFGSLRRKDILQRANSTEGAIEREPTKVSKSKYSSDGRSKTWRKNRKIVIGEPMLQTGHERLGQMKCVPVDVTGAEIKELQIQHRVRKNSSHSLISSSSSSGGPSTASTPASRFQAFPEETALDTMDLNSGARNISDRETTFFIVPSGHKPGTFPSSIREQSDRDCMVHTPSSASSTRSRSDSDPHLACSSDGVKLARSMSIYDNLPESALQSDASAQDLLNIMDPTAAGGVEDSGIYEGSQESLDVTLSTSDQAFWSVDDIVEHTMSLQEMVKSWEEETPDEDKPEIASTYAEEIVDRHIPNINETISSYCSENVPMAEREDEMESINCANAEQRSRLCPTWQNSTRDHVPVSCNKNSSSLLLDTLSVGQLMILRRLSVLKLTALLENYAFSNNNKGAFNWSVTRFIRRHKVPDYKDKTVFGVPLLQNVQRIGQPLPHCIQHALAFLRRSALDQIGLFRKPGVRSRIQKLRARCEENANLSNFDDSSAYDVADMVKQYFRELPDPLMTTKLSETFVGIFLYVPENLRLQTLQAATMLLPDETRETLKTLLYFLADVASNSAENHMNESNLSTCFAPSLFYQQFYHARLISSTTSSPKTRKQISGKTHGVILGQPDIREMNENKAANQCLSFMISHVNDLFKTSEDAMTQCRISVMEQTEDVLASEIGNLSDHHDEKDYYEDFHAYVDRTVAQTLREEQRIAQNKGGWQTVANPSGSELLCKKMTDGNPLRLWRSQVEVDGANPSQIMERILHERHIWDENLVQWKVNQQPDERTQLFQTVRSEMSPHPSRDYCVLRSWRTDVNSRGAAAIVEVSTSQPSLMGDIRGVILTSRYIIEPTDSPNKCTLTHVTRVDTKGRNPEWYNKAYGHVITQQLLKIRDSFK